MAVVTRDTYFAKVVEIVQESEPLKGASVGIAKQVGCAAAGTIAGGIIGGPVGASVGGMLGAGIGYGITNDYTSLAEVLRNLSEDDRERIVKAIQELVNGTTIDELAGFVAREAQRALLMKTVKCTVGYKN